jgi:hypothetical protein
LAENPPTIATPGERPTTSVSPAGPLQRTGELLLSHVTEKRFITLLLVLFIAKGVIITFAHAPYSGHDEVAHYAYLQVVAEEGRIPELPDLEEWRATYAEQGVYVHDRMPEIFWQYCRRTTIDWSPGCGDYERAIYAMTLAGEFYPTGWIYTANHPPLYYLVMTPLYWLTDGMAVETQLYIFRMAAIPFGLATVVLAWLTTRTLFPRERFLVLLVPAVVAFQPQVSYESAMLNNDILAIAFSSAVIYLIARGLKYRFPPGTVALIGFFYGLAVLSKNTSLTAGAIIAFAMIFGIGVRRWREWMAKGGLAAGIAGMMIWPWYLYMYRTYGDFTGLKRIRELQYWNYGDDRRPSIWAQLESQRFMWGRWRETWGEFGWRLIPLSPELLRGIFWVCLLAAVGIAVWAVRLLLTQRAMLAGKSNPETDLLPAGADAIWLLERWQVVGVLTMGVACILAYLAILQFGTTFSLTQARYYFPAIVPAALLFAIGWRALLPRRWLIYGQAVLFIGLVMLNVVIYSAYVLPYWESVSVEYPGVHEFYR